MLLEIGAGPSARVYAMSKSVLIVDDSKSVRKVVRSFFETLSDWTVKASVVTSKAANGGHFKTGQRMWPGTRWFYAKLPCSGKSVFVRQLRGPHLRT